MVVERQFVDALRHDNSAADECGAEVVVQDPNAVGGLVGTAAFVMAALRRRERRDVVADDRQRLVERGDTLVGEVLADEFKFVFVEQSRLHRDGILSVDERRDFDIDELDGMWGRRRGAGPCMSRDMVLSVLLRRHPRDQGAARKTEVCEKIYTCRAYPQASRGVRGLK